MSSEPAELLRAEEGAALLGAAGVEPGADPVSLFQSLLRSEDWWEDPEEAEALRRPLLRLAATYLTSSTGGSGPADPVARFHLGNGARLERINWLGNVATRGIKESLGIMVNYLYDPEAIEANHETFARDGTVVRSPAIDDLLASDAPATGAVRSRSRKSLGRAR